MIISIVSRLPFAGYIKGLLCEQMDRLDTGMARTTSSMECSNEHISR